VLNLIRSTRNTFSPVNRAPPEVLSLILDYWEDSDRDGASLKLTHVSCYWREVFVSCPLLWTRLNCKNLEKTRAYVERSKTSPLEIHPNGLGATHYHEEVLLLAVPHVDRVKTLTVSDWQSTLSAMIVRTLAENFSRPIPLLEKLKLNFVCYPPITLPDTLFDGELSSLRKLRLAGVLTPLSWGRMENLAIFNLYNTPGDMILLTCLLDFFESVPRLHDIRLQDSTPDESNAPPRRIVFLPNLKKLVTITKNPNPFLLDHLSC